jgi:CelD/BcsL family acetyltransferase involved in cellulose biosynthesis
MRPGWILAWSRAFARGRLCALTAVRGGGLVGILPFVERRGVLSAPANWHTPVYGYLATDQHVSAALALAFVSRARVRADLAFLDVGDHNLAACRRAAELQNRTLVLRSIMRSPYVRLSGDWESYRASLPRKVRRELERSNRRLRELGSLSVQVTDGEERLAAFLKEGFRLEGSGWKQRRRSAILSQHTTQRFYTDIALWASARQSLRLAFLRLDGNAIAFDFCIKSGDAMYVLKGGFDPAFRRFGPGKLLTYESLHKSFEDGLASYELLGDSDEYKLVWTDTTRERVRFQTFPKTPRGQMNYLLWTRGRGAIQRVRDVTRNRM